MTASDSTVFVFVREAARTGYGVYLCSCGKEKEFRHSAAKARKTRNCACDRSKKYESHGMSKTPEYNVWACMKQRCHDKNFHNYNDYGGRGITVCERWLGPGGFSNFLSDMGLRPFPGAQIDRKDNDGNYEPGNCCWSTAKKNCRHRRSTRWLTWKGETKCMTEWAEQFGVTYFVLYERVKRNGEEKTFRHYLGDNSP